MPLPLRTCQSAFLIVCLSLCSSCADYSFAQAEDVRFVVSAGGPLGRIKQLKFAANSMQLLAGGYDKRLFVWNLVREAESHRLLRATRSNSVFWGLSRDRRGLIESFDVTAGPDLLAIAGSSIRYDYGDISVIQPRPIKVRNVLPDTRIQEAEKDSGHRESVLSVHFSPDGKRLSSIDLSGKLIVWDVESGKALLSYPGIPTSSPGQSHIQSFIDDDTLVFTQETRAGACEIYQVDLRQESPQPVNLSRGRCGRVWAVAAAPDGTRWVCSDTQGKLYFWKSSELRGSRKLIPTQQERLRLAMSAEFGPDQMLLLNLLVIARDRRESRTQLEIWDWEEMKPRHADDAVKVGRAEIGAGGMRTGLAAAISQDPEGLLVAGIDDLRNAIHVFEVDETGRFRREDGEPVKHVLKGNADVPLKVRFSKAPLRLQISSAEAPPRVISLKEARLEKLPPQAIDWVDDPESINGWRVTQSDNNTRVTVLKDGVQRFHVSLDSNLQGRYATHSWLTDRRGAVYAVAIGTQTNSIFVYSTHPQTAGRMLRYFRDHAGAIHDLSVSADGRFLSSASNDGTVKVWSLQDLQEPPGTSPEKSAWGAVFELQNNAGRLVVSEVLDGGIAASRGLKTGDVVTRFEKTSGDNLKTATGTESFTKPRSMLQAIRKTILFDQVTIDISRRDEQQQTQTLRRRLVPGWEPLVTVLIDNDQEWAIWTPDGHYSTSLHGDQLFGWLINPENRTGTPRFFSARQVRREFDQPDVLRNLFAEIQIPIPVATKPIPGEMVRERLGRVSQSIPKVQITGPPDLNSAVHEKPVTITAEVTYPNEPEDYRVKAYLNGGFESQPRVEAMKDGVRRYRWQVKPSEVNNQFKIRVDRKDQKQHEALHQEASTSFKARPPESDKPVRVHLVGIGVEDYAPPDPFSNTVYGDLPFAVDDVQSLMDAVKSGLDPKQFQVGSEYTLLFDNKDNLDTVSRESIETLFHQLGSSLNENRDLLVVTVVGHGTVDKDTSEYCFIVSDGQTNSRVHWETFWELASKVHCRKLFLFDTCHAGAITKSALQSLDAESAAVVAAAGADEQSHEPPALDEQDFRKPFDKLNGKMKNGTFTHFLITGLNGTADGFESGSKDGLVQIREAVSFTAAKVPEFMEGAYDPALNFGRPYQQHPDFYPRNLAGFGGISLTRNPRHPRWLGDRTAPGTGSLKLSGNLQNLWPELARIGIPERPVRHTRRFVDRFPGWDERDTISTQP